MVICKKGQAATEFLISYGWVIFLLIMGAVSLMLFFEFDRAMFVREECVIVPGLNCGDIRITEDSMSLTVLNDVGWDYSSMQITHADCNIPSYDEYFEVGKYVTFTLADCDFEGGELFEENDVFVTYTLEESSVTHTKSANIVSVVEGGTTQRYSGDGGSGGGSPGGDWNGGGNDGTYDPNADGATLLLCDFDVDFNCVGGNPLSEINVTLVNGVNGQAAFVEQKTNLISNGDFEGTLPVYWYPYVQNSAVIYVGTNDKFSYRGDTSGVTTRAGNLFWPGFCDEITCSYKSYCTWDSVNKKCSYSSACVTDCGNHVCGAKPDVYNEGDTLCAQNTNKVMYGGIRYGSSGSNPLFSHFNLNYDQDYSLSFMYRGSFPSDLMLHVCYTVGWCSMGMNYPSINWNYILAGDYSSWQYYSDDIYVDNNFETACGGASCFRELAIGKFPYSTSQPGGDTFYLDNVQLEKGKIASPFAGDGGDVLKYPANSNTLDLEKGTVEMWVYVNDKIKDVAQNRYVFAHRGSCGSGCYSNRMSFGHLSSGVWNFAISNSSGAGSSISLQDNLVEGWHHFAVTWNKYAEGGYIEMFIDGTSVQKNINIANRLPDNYEDGIYVGGWGSTYGWIDTVVDEFRISDIVRYT